MNTVFSTARPDGRWVMYACLLLGSAFFLMDMWLPLGVAGGVPYVAVVLISLWAPPGWVRFPFAFPFAVAIAVSLLTAVGFFLSPPGSQTWIVLTNRGLALFAIWVTAALGVARASVQARWRASLEAELRTVSGLLPICASCKNIRDDSGYWQKVEKYFTARTDAQFSHSICPPCTKKLYPDLYQELFPNLEEARSGGGPAVLELSGERSETTKTSDDGV